MITQPHGMGVAGVPEMPQPRSPMRTIRASLSARLLFLTIVFVMLAEIAIFAPTMALFRLDYLRQKLASAHLILTALEASPGQIDPVLRDRLLDQADMSGMTADRPRTSLRTLGPRMPSRVPKVYDLRRDSFLDLTADAFMTMMRKGNPVTGVRGISPLDKNVVMEVVLEEQPMRSAMWTYARRIFFVSLFISISTGILVYVSLQWLAVRPLRRLTDSMVSFQTAPEDATRIIIPEPRRDEVGVAEHALAGMQSQLREALVQKSRLAGVGAAVTKISHDLKNVLATATLESSRLENVPDPDVKRIAAGLVRAVDRAAQLAASTLRFAGADLPQPALSSLNVRVFFEELRTHFQASVKSCVLEVSTKADIQFQGDPDLLYRSFENLVRNACEAGATVVTLSAVVEGGHLLVHIADNGSGLPPRALANLFQPFAGSARSGGTGLGLPIARELLRAQGGDLMLESSSAAGAVFIARLPS